MAVLIEAHDLKKRFGDIIAVDGISLEVSKGQVLGFLGPNGAWQRAASPPLDRSR